MKTMVDPENVKKMIDLEKELKEAKNEIMKLRKAQTRNEPLLNIQQELEREKLSNKSLKDKLEVEKAEHMKVKENLTILQKYCKIFGLDPSVILANHNQNNKQSSPTKADLDSLGLRSLWSQSGPPPTQQVQPQQSQQPLFSSSAGSALFQNHFSQQSAANSLFPNYGINLVSSAATVTPPVGPQARFVNMANLRYPIAPPPSGTGAPKSHHLGSQHK